MAAQVAGQRRQVEYGRRDFVQAEAAVAHAAHGAVDVGQRLAGQGVNPVGRVAIVGAAPHAGAGDGLVQAHDVSPLFGAALAVMICP